MTKVKKNTALNVRRHDLRVSRRKGLSERESLRPELFLFSLRVVGMADQLFIINSDSVAEFTNYPFKEVASPEVVQAGYIPYLSKSQKLIALSELFTTVLPGPVIGITGATSAARA